MPLTKSEFDRWKAQRDEAIEKIRDIPRAPGVASIDAAGFLRVVGNSGDGFEPEATRSLYEMLRAWYGESSMTEKAKAVIDLIGRTPCVRWPQELIIAYDAYRAEQEQ